MAEKMKEIGSYSLEVLDMSIKRLSQEKQSNLTKILDEIKNELPDKSPTKKKCPTIVMSPKRRKAERFEILVHEMEREIANFEMRQNSEEGEELSHLAAMPNDTKFERMKLKDLKIAHDRIKSTETDIQIFWNLCHFMR
ncbi:hypothetical protein [Methanosarcina sp.]|uniref:hypothetical protein n=1 Tax=Methanosarcina sp. TaxID=2213 RepID=UPI003BB519A8